MAHDKMIVLTLRQDAPEGEVLTLQSRLVTLAANSHIATEYTAIESVQVRPFEPLVKPDEQL